MMSRAIGYLCGAAATILVLIAVWVLLSIPSGNEPDDFVAPLVGGALLVLSAIALAINAQVVLRLARFPQPRRVVVHLANIVAVALLAIGIMPWLLTMPYLFAQDWALLSLPAFILASYLYSIHVLRGK